jgi:hypothetical protein
MYVEFTKQSDGKPLGVPLGFFTYELRMNGVVRLSTYLGNWEITETLDQVRAKMALAAPVTFQRVNHAV